MKRMVSSIVSMLVVLLLVGGIFYMINNRSNYLETDNARITADLQPVGVAAAGKLQAWNVNVGDTVTQGDALGTETSGTSTTHVSITAPLTGTVIQTNATAGQIIAPGQPLAMIADLSKMHVSAYIDENTISDVRVGQQVDVYVDADPNLTLNGRVSSIGQTAGTFLSPSVVSGSTNRDTKQTQRVPVSITVDNLQTNGIVPGMNASIRIHK
ncbi:efflux RND transporter periplasmic adaptor subunit [Aneurinibacillus uraniidurans]|uniref:efflux RND transporter periplasmic adaptor subunit n=1 Tax=Aneurinibacillus uraniidurans TaxID=2966586 RepID=UPI002349EE3F|nr:efflux RND transporter periplasmic adaptor subunit [Aneurinibacillus sp. B1]WCN36205.1 efflux RND transporter periplasmic adaptor subunit [Aneurinibacillus sp. B1]